jgi:hypothetical protein
MSHAEIVFLRRQIKYLPSLIKDYRKQLEQAKNKLKDHYAAK